MRFWTAVVILSVSFANSARAVIQVPPAVTASWDQASLVVAGKVTRIVDAQKRAIQVDVTTIYKGTPADKTLFIQINKPEELFAQVKEGQSVVIMDGRRSGIHLANTWVLAERRENARRPIWDTIGPPNDFVRAFPGRTSALLLLLDELKAGKRTLLNSTEEDFFKGEFRRFEAKLPPDCRFIHPLDPKRLLIISPAGLTLHSLSDLAPIAAPGLRNAPATIAASGDLNSDGNADMLIGSELFIGANDGWTRSGAFNPPADKPLATAILAPHKTQPAQLALLNSDGRLHIAHLDNAKQLRQAEPVQLWKDGSASSAIFGNLADDGGPAILVAREDGITRYGLAAQDPASDLARLTGDKFESHHKADGGKLKNPRLTAIDINNDGRMDALLLADNGGFVLINRGFGCFFISTRAAEPLRAAGSPITTASLLSAVDLTSDEQPDLLIVNPDGVVHAAPGTPHVRK